MELVLGSLFDLVHNLGKEIGMLHGEFGKHLPIEVNVGFRHERNEPRVSETVGAQRRVEANDPESTEGPFLHPSISKGIVHGAQAGLPSQLDEVLPAMFEALGPSQEIGVSLPSLCATFDARHVVSFDRLPTREKFGQTFVLSSWQGVGVARSL